jgi:hypothetical protein
LTVEKINLLPFRRTDSFPYEAPGYANSRHEMSGSHQVCNGNGIPTLVENARNVGSNPAASTIWGTSSSGKTLALISAAPALAA